MIDTAAVSRLASAQPNDPDMTMKIHALLLSLLAVFALALTGCGGAGGGASIDTSALEKSFSSAEAGLKDAATKAIDAVKKSDFNGALKELQGLAANVKLTDEQKNAINGLIEQVKKAVTDAASKATEGVNKAVGDAQKALPK